MLREFVETARRKHFGAIVFSASVVYAASAQFISSVGHDVSVAILPLANGFWISSACFAAAGALIFAAYAADKDAGPAR